MIYFCIDPKSTHEIAQSAARENAMNWVPTILIGGFLLLCYHLYMSFSPTETRLNGRMSPVTSMWAHRISIILGWLIVAILIIQIRTFVQDNAWMLKFPLTVDSPSECWINGKFSGRSMSTGIALILLSFVAAWASLIPLGIAHLVSWIRSLLGGTNKELQT